MSKSFKELWEVYGQCNNLKPNTYVVEWSNTQGCMEYIHSLLEDSNTQHSNDTSPHVVRAPNKHTPDIHPELAKAYLDIISKFDARVLPCLINCTRANLYVTDIYTDNNNLNYMLMCWVRMLWACPQYVLGAVELDKQGLSFPEIIVHLSLIASKLNSATQYYILPVTDYFYGYIDWPVEKFISIISTSVEKDRIRFNQRYRAACKPSSVDIFFEAYYALSSDKQRSNLGTTLRLEVDNLQRANKRPSVDVPAYIQDKAVRDAYLVTIKTQLDAFEKECTKCLVKLQEEL